MKLPDFTQNEHLNRIRRLMNAPLPERMSFSQQINQLTMADLEIMEGKGLDISSDELRILEDETLAYKDSRILLYIRDVQIYHNRGYKASLPKFHVANCRTLQKMREDKRFDRYVVSIRTDGKFELIFLTGHRRRNKTAELKICKNCLDHLRYKGYRHGDSTLSPQIFENFNIEEYFTYFPRSLVTSKPTYTSANAPLNDYSPGFAETSREYRTQKDWICNKCGVDLSALPLRRYLHTHHKNGLKYDDREENLEALCIRCHADEPREGHIKNLNDYKAFMSLYPSLRSKSIA